MISALAVSFLLLFPATAGAISDECASPSSRIGDPNFTCAPGITDPECKCSWSREFMRIDVLHEKGVRGEGLLVGYSGTSGNAKSVDCADIRVASTLWTNPGEY